MRPALVFIALCAACSPPRGDVRVCAANDIEAGFVNATLVEQLVPADARPPHMTCSPGETLQFRNAADGSTWISIAANVEGEALVPDDLSEHLVGKQIRFRTIDDRDSLDELVVMDDDQVFLAARSGQHSSDAVGGLEVSLDTNLLGTTGLVVSTDVEDKTIANGETETIGVGDTTLRFTAVSASFTPASGAPDSGGSSSAWFAVSTQTNPLP